MAPQQPLRGNIVLVVDDDLDTATALAQLITDGLGCRVLTALSGDEALRIVGAILKETVRGADVAARYGGEEFSVLLIQCDPAKGFLISERIREAIAGRKVMSGDKELSVTVSIGVAHTATKTLVPYAATLIDQADQALYAAKHAGRNRAVQWRESVNEAVP